jgi:hypothetical protein
MKEDEEWCHCFQAPSLHQAVSSRSFENIGPVILLDIWSHNGTYKLLHRLVTLIISSSPGRRVDLLHPVHSRGLQAAGPCADPGTQ